jgi:hypothetical protein
MKIAPEYGGLGLSNLYYSRALVIVGSASPALMALLSAHQSKRFAGTPGEGPRSKVSGTPPLRSCLRPSSLAFLTRRVSSSGMDTDPAGEFRCAPAPGEACVLDPARPCRACLAPSPRDCPYLYLLYDMGAPVPPPGPPGPQPPIRV